MGEINNSKTQIPFKMDSPTITLLNTTDLVIIIAFQFNRHLIENSFIIIQHE